MTELRETAAMIGLLRRGGRLWHQYADLVESCGSAIEVLASGDEPGVDEPAGTLFEMDPPAPADEPDLDAIMTEIRGWQAEGIRVLSILDDEYPPNLRTIHNRPPLLFVRGALIDSDVRSIAIVGTRRASGQGLAAATSVAADLGEHGFTVVSGLAEGVDSAAHRAALAHDRRTIAVIGTGIRRSYPAKNTELQREIASVGAVVSQFWPDAPPTRTSFPMRNIVMSGLSQATVVIEASHTSGAKMQARFALEHGRPVFLLASLLEHAWAREYAERPGAHVIENAGDVVEHVERLTSIETLSA
jgi:DNA processing protein